jgi:putative transposase
MAYSVDLRVRVVDYARSVKGGQKKAAALFRVGRATVKRWLKREKLEADKPGPRDANKLNRKHLQEVVETKPDLYLDEYAEMIGSKRSTVFYNLKVLKISRKKNHALRRKKRG